MQRSHRKEVKFVERTRTRTRKYCLANSKLPHCKVVEKASHATEFKGFKSLNPCIYKGFCVSPPIDNGWFFSYLNLVYAPVKSELTGGHRAVHQAPLYRTFDVNIRQFFASDGLHSGRGSEYLLVDCIDQVPAFLGKSRSIQSHSSVFEPSNRSSIV